jgi:hypothetical protein
MSLSIFCLTRIGSLNFEILWLVCGGYKCPFQVMAMGSWLMFYFIFFISCCIKFKVQWWESWKHKHFMCMFSMCKDLICELFMCKVFFLFIVWIFLCEPLCLQTSMHDSLASHKKIILRTNQNWWNNPTFNQTWALETLKKSCKTLL